MSLGGMGATSGGPRGGKADRYHPPRPTRSITMHLGSLRPLDGSAGRLGPARWHWRSTERAVRGVGGCDEWRAEGRQGGSLPPSTAHTLDYYVPRELLAARWVRGSPWADALAPEVVRTSGEGWCSRVGGGRVAVCSDFDT